MKLLIFTLLFTFSFVHAASPPKEDGPNGHKLVLVPAGKYPLGEKDHR